MNNIIVSAPGKLHILGEHSAVYGKPAILAATDKRCTIILTKREDKLVEIIATNADSSITLPIKTLLNKTKDAQKQWLAFSKSNDSSQLLAITKHILDYPIICIGETLLFYKQKNISGFTLTITSDIPISAGMGSSSAVAVAIAKGVSLFLKQEHTNEVINTIAFLAEQKKHGFPSGGDTATSCYGGLIWYKKESDGTKIVSPISFRLSSKIAKNFLILFSGNPTETTGEMVSSVKNLYKKQPTVVQTILDNQEQLVHKLLQALQEKNEKQITHILQKGEKNLEKLDVVSTEVMELIKKIEKSGGAAKICGGGGKIKGTGIILVYHKQKKLLEKLLKSFTYDYATVQLGSEGIKIENER